MNILIVCHYGLYQDLTFSFVHNQAKEYAKLGHRVRVILPIGFGKRGRTGRRVEVGCNTVCAAGVELFEIRYVTLSSYGDKNFNRSSAVCAVRCQLKRILDGFQPDVIHAHTLGFDSEIGAWLKAKLGCPLVVTTHGSDTNVPLQQGRQEALKKWCDQADAVVAVSNQLKDRLATCGTKTKLYGIFNGFVPRAVPAEIQRKPHSMIQVGHLIPGKRVDVTIRAFEILRKRYSDMTLTIVGQGPLRQELEQLCTELGVADGVTFTGQLPNDRVFEQLCQAEFFVMVSKPEGFGIVYLEAMAAGCVTIGTRGEGIGDVIEDGRNGFLVPADDPGAIARIVEDCLHNPEESDLIRRAGMDLARMMTWEWNARAYIDLFKEMRQ